jgi:hypothetical protein
VQPHAHRSLVERAAIAAALCMLCAWSCWQRWQLLAGSPFPLGVDGYFYPLELRALLDHGRLAYPASPLAFYLLAPFAAIAGPIAGAKLGAAVLGAAIAWPAYAVGARLGGGRGAGLVAAVLATTSVGSAYLSVEFVKNSVGLTVALAALWLVLRATERSSKPRIAAAVLGLAAAYASHKMAAAIVVLVAVPAALAAAAEHGALRGRRLLMAIAGVVLVVGGTLIAGALAPARLLSASDAALFHGVLATTARWTAPALVLPDGVLQLGHDALVGLALAIVGVALALRRRLRGATAPQPSRPRIPGAGWPIVILALAIGLPWLAVTDHDGLGFRLRAAAFVPMALTAALVSRALLARDARRDLVLAALAAVLAIVRQPAPGGQLDGEVVTHPALVSAAEALAGHVPPGAVLIVPERHIAFMVAWYTGAPVALRPERIPEAQRYRLLPLAFIGAGSALDRALLAARDQPALAPPFGVHPGHANGLVLIAEPTWRWILAQLPADERARLEAWPVI